MKNLKINELNAKKLYPTASPEFKQMLIDSFGESFFTEKIIDRIKNFDGILNILGKSYSDILPYKTPKTKAQISQNAFAKIQCITEVYNEGWIQDLTNYNQYKYYPCFKKNALDRWVFCYCFAWNSVAFGGFGSYFKTPELANDASTKFIDIYNDYLP